MQDIMTRFNLIAIAMCACLCLSSCHQKKEATVAPPLKVKAMVAEPSQMTMSRIYSGTVEESSGSSLSFSATGTIRQIYVNEGDRVAQGQLLAVLDDATLRNAHDITVSALNQAQDAYNRMKKLHDANALPDMQWVEVQNTLSQAQSAEAIARKALDDAKLYAPASGYVAQKYMDAGMNAAPGVPVVKIVSIGDVKVNISVPETEIQSITPGQEAQVTVSAVGDAPYTGVVTERGVSANSLSRAYDVKVTVPNPDAKLLPGMICDVRLRNDSTVAAVVLPINTVLLDADNQNFIWIARDGKAEKKIVTIEGLNDDGIIVDPRDVGSDSIIVEGLQKVSEGTRIEIIH